MAGAGWKLKKGDILENRVHAEKYWAYFNFVFSSNSKNTNTYKYGLIKAILDNLLNCTETQAGMLLSFENLFAKFAENYWGLVVTYGLQQMKFNGKSALSALEKILYDEVKSDSIIQNLRFDALNDITRKRIIRRVTTECKRYVLGALYADFDGLLYAFDLQADHILLSFGSYEFMMKYKMDIEKLNYYAWAQMLEQINEERHPFGILSKLDAVTPRRSDLSIYRELLRQEFEVNTCFYCGKKLSTGKIHVDHFIPWTFVKEDKLWNFVLSCPTCNERKNSRLPEERHIVRICERNEELQASSTELVVADFASYHSSIIPEMWEYASMGGFKVFSQNA